ncbi:MAG: thymidine phosphorylase [Acidobacteriota bacterium]
MAGRTIRSILETKRDGGKLDPADLTAVSQGAATGEWGEAELGAFLMAAFVRGLDVEEAAALTRAMLESGEQWRLADDMPLLGDKHSTGGVGDTVSLVLAPLFAACDLPMVKLTGRGLGHTGGTADKLDAIPGLDLHLDRERACRLVDEVGLAIGIATDAIAPADRKLYELRDRTGTVGSLPLIAASILSKKLATGAAAMVFDVKVGTGALVADLDASRALARELVDVGNSLGTATAAVLTDMHQPLGEWAGHTAELREAYDCLEGRGAEDLMTVVYTLGERLSTLLGHPVSVAELEAAITSGRARERFDRWAAAQGADPSWLARPDLELAPEEVVVTASRSGVLARVATRELGNILIRAGGGRVVKHAPIDTGVSLRRERMIGDDVRAGEPLARLHLRRHDAELVRHAEACFEIDDEATAHPFIHDHVA